MHSTEVKVVGLSFRQVKENLKTGDKVQLVHEKDNKYDPNALAVQTPGGQMLGYVGKNDPLRLRILEKARKKPVQLNVLIANYYKEGEEKLWAKVEEGDMVQLWLRAFSKAPLEDNSFVELTSFTGEKVMWSEFLHICTDLKGNELMGGSTYAKQFDKPFDRERIAKAYAKKNGFKVEDVLAYWDSLGRTAMDYGTSVHMAMEHYAKSHEVFGHEASLPRVPHLRDAVLKFLEVSNFDGVVAEPLITDIEKGMSGWTDVLRINVKDVWIEDYKTNTFNSDDDYKKKWPEKLKIYQHQMNYYGTILQNHGYTVKGIVVWHWHEGRWQKHEFPFKAIREYQR
jgi:hypothetical protein